MAEHNIQDEIIGEGDAVAAIVQRSRGEWLVYEEMDTLFDRHFNGAPFNLTVRRFGPAPPYDY
ncbi:unnamed protein product [Brassica oleracea var. botrytis]|uniref:Uncharacterized protein n=2 Tax=Brassica TaxID=3705 RepID=A0A3P6G1J2_BRAOL|nr:unnamed protein product [Brassica napus]VDD48129.1 unnamed protein product [Brassica oleracea]